MVKCKKNIRISDITLDLKWRMETGNVHFHGYTFSWIDEILFIYFDKYIMSSDI